MWSDGTKTALGEKVFRKKKFADTFLLFICYSQTGCSFPRNFADFRRDISNLIGSLLRAICNWRDQFATELVEVAAPISIFMMASFDYNYQNSFRFPFQIQIL